YRVMAAVRDRDRLRRRLEHFSVPHLELEQNPQPERVVGRVRPMLVDQALDLAAPEVAALERTRVEQDLGGEVAQLLAEPGGERHSESHLRPLEDLRRENPPERALQQPL